VLPRLPPCRGSALLSCLGALSCAVPAARVAPPNSPTFEGSEACALAAPTGSSPDTLSVALSGGVDPRHWPAAGTATERFVFRQLYESLIRIDCAGQVWPGLAQSWRADASGRVWVFTIRSDARFWDGLPVRGQDVIAAWQNRANGLPADVTVQARSDRDIQVILPRPMAEVPRAFADPEWAVTRAVPGAAWLVGTGRFRADSVDGHLGLVPLVGGAPVIALRAMVAGDMRDLLDAGVDVLVTAEPATLSYAAGRPDLMSLPLPWDSTYVLLAQSEVALSDSVRGGLARDAVRVEARPAAGPFWWNDREGCEDASGRGVTVNPFQPVRSTWIALQGDGTAYALMERLVALRRTGADTAVRAITLAPVPFEAAVRSGRWAGSVFAVPRQPPDACRAMKDLMAAAPWLSGGVIVPLIDTRRRVVVRRGASAFTVDWDGTLHLR
jgi:hypothetical protein